MAHEQDFPFNESTLIDKLSLVNGQQFIDFFFDAWNGSFHA